MKKLALATMFLASTSVAANTLECVVIDHVNNQLGKGEIGYNMQNDGITPITSYNFAMEVSGRDEINDEITSKEYTKLVKFSGNRDSFQGSTYGETNDLFNGGVSIPFHQMVFIKTGTYYHALTISDVSYNFADASQIGHISGKFYQGSYGSEYNFSIETEMYFDCGTRLTVTDIVNTQAQLTKYKEKLNELTVMTGEYVDTIKLQTSVMADQTAYITSAKETITSKDEIIANYKSIIDGLTVKIENWKNIVDALAAELNAIKTKSDFDNEQTIDWYVQETGLLNQRIDALEAQLQAKETASASVQQLDVESTANVAPVKGGSGSMGLGLALLGIFGRRFKK
jgi:hypothetical protein